MPGTFNVVRANTNAIVTVSRLGGTNGAVQVSYATVAGGTAVIGADYTSVSGVLNWTNGETSVKTISVPIVDNGLAESNRTVFLALSNPTNGAAIGPQTTAVLNILSAPYDVWRFLYFGLNANTANIGGDSADAAADGIPNLLKYAYGLNPLLAETNPFTGKRVGNTFQVTFPRNASASDITYRVQASVGAGLTVWTNLLVFDATSGGWVTNVIGSTVSESATNGPVTNQFVNVSAITSTNAVTGGTNQFLRLQVHH